MGYDEELLDEEESIDTRAHQQPHNEYDDDTFQPAEEEDALDASTLNASGGIDVHDGQGFADASMDGLEDSTTLEARDLLQQIATPPPRASQRHLQHVNSTSHSNITPQPTRYDSRAHTTPPIAGQAADAEAEPAELDLDAQSSQKSVYGRPPKTAYGRRDVNVPFDSGSSNLMNRPSLGAAPAPAVDVEFDLDQPPVPVARPKAPASTQEQRRRAQYDEEAELSSSASQFDEASQSNPNISGSEEDVTAETRPTHSSSITRAPLGSRNMLVPDMRPKTSKGSSLSVGPAAGLLNMSVLNVPLPSAHFAGGKPVLSKLTPLGSPSPLPSPQRLTLAPVGSVKSPQSSLTSTNSFDFRPKTGHRTSHASISRSHSGESAENSAEDATRHESPRSNGSAPSTPTSQKGRVSYEELQSSKGQVDILTFNSPTAADRSISADASRENVYANSFGDSHESVNSKNLDQSATADQDEEIEEEVDIEEEEVQVDEDESEQQKEEASNEQVEEDSHSKSMPHGSETSQSPDAHLYEASSESVLQASSEQLHEPNRPSASASRLGSGAVTPTAAAEYESLDQSVEQSTDVSETHSPRTAEPEPPVASTLTVAPAASVVPSINPSTPTSLSIQPLASPSSVASSAPPSPAVLRPFVKGQLCEMCDDDLATLYCPFCKLFLCERGKCDQQVHETKRTSTHERIPFNPPSEEVNEESLITTPIPVASPTSPLAAASSPNASGSPNANSTGVRSIHSSLLHPSVKLSPTSRHESNFSVSDSAASTPRSILSPRSPSISTPNTARYAGVPLTNLPHSIVPVRFGLNFLPPQIALTYDLFDCTNTKLDHRVHIMPLNFKGVDPAEAKAEDVVRRLYRQERHYLGRQHAPVVSEKQVTKLVQKLLDAARNNSV